MKKFDGRKWALANGLSAAEWDRIGDLLERPPNRTEIGIFSAMWSEHCCYKSSRLLLKNLPTKGPHVLDGPGENAGVIDIGDGLACVFKIESHNHPSFIEPYQGAATGVGGILRDIFTMGARPVAILDSLHFGDPDHPRTRSLIDGVVRGVGGYGNCIGIPTVGGACRFHPSYNGNILVNVMAAGIVKKDRIFRSAARKVGARLLYFGSATGRDGIHGASMASQEFRQETESQRPTVQVGDPLKGKMLLETSLELMDSGAILAIQDMGAAGLTSSSFEMASKGKVGIALNLDHVPQREEGMDAFDIMLSESQERMLAVIDPDFEDTALDILKRQRIDHAFIGHVCRGSRVTGEMHSRPVFDLPVHVLVEDAPAYRRRQEPPSSPLSSSPPTSPLPSSPSSKNPSRPPQQPTRQQAKSSRMDDPGDILLQMMGGCHLSSRRWIWQQYDHSVGANTLIGPGGDAAVVRVHGTNKALALCVTGTEQYCIADPMIGAMQAVCEGWRNLNCVGAKPLAVTDNLNYGNPEQPSIMFQIAAGIDGIAQACRALGLPVVSGNVSLYNETNGKSIAPTPIIGMVGLIDPLDQRMSHALPGEDWDILMIGTSGVQGQDQGNQDHQSACLYAWQMDGVTGDTPPPVDPSLEKRHGEFVREQILAPRPRVGAAHDIARGGFLVALARMCLAGAIGARIKDDANDKSLPDEVFLFGEEQGRYLLATRDADKIIAAAKQQSIPCRIVARSGSQQLTWGSKLSISLTALRHRHESWLEQMMEHPSNPPG